MNHRGFVCALLLALFFSLSPFILPSPAFAATAEPCSAPALSASGYFFTAYDDPEYSLQNLLEYHFKIVSTYADGRSFKISLAYKDDECNPSTTSNLQYAVSLPAGVTNWSVRFSSQTHFDIWDDQHAAIITGFDISAYPNYTSIAVNGNIDGGGSAFTSRTFKINQNGIAPSYQGTINKPSSCSGVTAGGYYFDSFEHAEYVDGLLRVHLRLKTPYNDGRYFGSTAVTADNNCAFTLSPAAVASLNTNFPSFVRYYSFRMSSSTHWVLWDDEHDTQIICTACSGDIPSGTPFVLWYARIDGTASTIQTTPFPPAQTLLKPCCSNVLFLPGIEASRLYRPDGAGGENRLWEPPVAHDNSQLAMTINGTSVRSDIYTKDAIDSALGVDIYGSFFSSMQQLAASNGFEFKAFPYDWRYAADLIASNPTQLATTTIALLGEIKRLAASSQTGKVTIIAHSNGGLVAKEALLQLGADTARYVDRIIFVAVPQVGTPQAVAGLLHGYEQGMPVSWAPLLISDSESRDLGDNMPGAYGLLPSAGYFSSVSTPVATFSSLTLPDWASRYGSSINSQSGLNTFLTDTAGRTEPIMSDLSDPTILSNALLSQSQLLHQNIDAWIPPAGVQLIQIAGWGIPETVTGISYSKKDGNIVSNPYFSIDGDGTVVVPSALWMSTAVGAKDYWLNLKSYNTNHPLQTLGGFIPFEHSGIFAAEPLVNFVSDFLTNSVKPISNYTYLSTDAPPSNGSRLRFTLHSPLTLELYDDQGHHTGVSPTTGQIEEQIPGTYYSQFGDVKYLFTDATSTLHIFMQGYATSTFTFEAQELQGDTLVASTTWKDIPTTPKTKVSLDTTVDLSTQNPLKIDKNGDGIIDYVLNSKLNDTATFPKVPITINPDSKAIILGEPVPILTATLAGFVGGDTVSSSDVIGAPVCTTTATASSPVGAYPIVCSVGTLASNTYTFSTTSPGTLTISYRWDGFLQPINDTAHQIGQSLSVFKAGSTVPIKLQLKKTNGTPVQAITPPIWLGYQKGSVMSSAVDESVYSDLGSIGSSFKWDSATQQYIYNWNTKGLTPSYWYRVYTQLDDGKIYSVTIGLR